MIRFRIGLMLWAAIVAAWAAVFLLSKPAPAAERCDVALQLSFDISGSMDLRAYRLVIDGTAQAVRSPEMVQGFSKGAIYVQIVFWAERQQVMLDWQRIDGEAGAAALSSVLSTLPRPDLGTETGLGSAVAFGGAQFAHAPACARQVMDVAGDGDNNTGSSLLAARLSLDPNIMVNGIATTPQAAAYYQKMLASGPGAFVIHATAEEFAEAMRRKLITELDLS